VSNDRQRSGLPATPGNVLVGTPLGRPLAQDFSIDYERGQLQDLARNYARA
jgi:hypothetical protein